MSNNTIRTALKDTPTELLIAKLRNAQDDLPVVPLHQRPTVQLFIMLISEELETREVIVETPSKKNDGQTMYWRGYRDTSW